MTTALPDGQTWVVVTPFKGLATAKSRLADVAGQRRPELALAMLIDTISAAQSARGVRSVLVVTDDPRVAAAVSAQRAVVLPDQPRAGLNAAFGYGITVAVQRFPGSGVALLTGDLPAARPAELEEVLRLPDLASHVIAVADRHGSGTTVLAARTPAALRPAFGVGSFARHRDLGAVGVELASLAGLRCDVDNAVDLQEAIRLGVGPATAVAFPASGQAVGPGS
jgi:2-phospho-L-lactate/phosphoenolpyruvate guanylyltransferase